MLIDPLTLTFNLLTSNKMGDQDLSCTIHLPSPVTIFPVAFVLEHTYTLHKNRYVQRY